MIMANLYSEELKPLVEDYSRRAERWQVDHEEAMACQNLEDLLLVGVSLSFGIDMIDTQWREAMMADQVPYASSDEEEIRDFYRTWLAPAEGMLANIARMEARGYEVKWADQFRRACREARAIFIDDSEFFMGDALVELRDRAIDDYREGRTVEFHELGG
jgi:hypothetical protein